jgi:hypothetical protein
MVKLWVLLGSIMLSALCLFLFSCSNTAVSPTNYSRLQVINAIPNSLSFDCKLNGTRINTTTIAFPNASGYISTVPGAKNVAIVPTSTPAAPNIDTVNVVLENNQNYSLFFTGQSGALGQSSTLKTIFITDTLNKLPATGRAKIRFVNASATAPLLDIQLNGTDAFTSVKYTGFAKFIEVPVGTYEFRAFTSGTRTSSLGTLSNQMLADGKIYTLYASGITGNTTTTSAFGLSLIANLPPAVK